MRDRQGLLKWLQRTYIAVGRIVRARGGFCKGKQHRRRIRGVVWRDVWNYCGMTEELRRVGSREVWLRQVVQMLLNRDDGRFR